MFLTNERPISVFLTNEGPISVFFRKKITDAESKKNGNEQKKILNFFFCNPIFDTKINPDWSNFFKNPISNPVSKTIGGLTFTFGRNEISHSPKPANPRLLFLKGKFYSKMRSVEKNFEKKLSSS